MNSITCASPACTSEPAPDSQRCSTCQADREAQKLRTAYRSGLRGAAKQRVIKQRARSRRRSRR